MHGGVEGVPRGRPAVPVPPDDACDRCLRRADLLGALAGRIEIERRGGPVGELLALDDEALLAALDDDHGTFARRFATFAPDRARAAARARGLGTTCHHAPSWPAALRRDAWEDDAATALHGPASVARALYVAGAPGRFTALTAADRPAVAVVGARRATAYGLGVARALGRGLSAAGVTVVSGMALGVDAAAHAGALEAGGETIAVLGGGPDVPYPASKAPLHAQLRDRAAVIAELPPGVGPRRWTFPARNRIIADLASVTVVVEAAARSGSLITAVRARERGREVAAVPGLVTNPQAAGAVALLKDGAHLVRDAADVLDLVLGVGHEVARRPVPAAPPRLAGLAAAVAAGDETVERLTADGRPVAEVLDGLAELELLGVVQRAPGGRWLAVPT